MSSSWSSDYDDPRWKEKREKILDRDNHECKICGDTYSFLHVHHGFYEKDRRAWTYPDHSLWTLCESCHEKVTYQNRDLKRVVGEMHPEKLDELIQHVQAFVNGARPQGNQGAALPQSNVEGKEIASSLHDDGLTTKWYSNGQKMCEGYFDDEGIGQGVHTWWYENGQKKSEGNFENDAPHGLVTEWYENGQKKLESHWKRGEREGLRTFWYENGQKWSEKHWKNGKLHGLLTCWHENGHKSIESHFKNGELDGTGASWHENGHKKLESQWKNGNPDGTSSYWDENGNMTYEIQYKDGVEISRKEF